MKSNIYNEFYALIRKAERTIKRYLESGRDDVHLYNRYTIVNNIVYIVVDEYQIVPLYTDVESVLCDATSIQVNE